MGVDCICDMGKYIRYTSYDLLLTAYLTHADLFCDCVERYPRRRFWEHRSCPLLRDL